MLCAFADTWLAKYLTDTQIEPAIGTPTTLPEALTNGLEYNGYGDLYLQILRRETVPTVAT